MPKFVSRRDRIQDLVICDPRSRPNDALEVSSRVEDRKFPERKRGDAWKIVLEDLILFRVAETVGFDDVPDPGYMGLEDDDEVLSVPGEKIGFKATAYFSKQQWPHFKHLETPGNAGRKRPSQKDAAGSIKIRGILRASLFLVPASKDHLTIESGTFFRYRVNSMAPETLKRSVSTLERFRLLDFMTKCRDEDVAVTHPGLNLKDKKIRPKQRSITWLTNQLRRPIKVPHLKSLLDKDNIVDQLRTHAAWIARYLRPMRANIYNQYFNVPIRQWEEFAERNSSLDTVTSLTMTKTDSSEDEALPVVPKAVIPRKRHIVESESEDEMFFDPKRLVRTRASARVVKIESTFDSDDEDLIGDEDEDEDDIAEITQDEFGGIQIPEVEDVIEWQDYEPEPEPERQTDHDHRVEQEQYVWDVLAATPSLQTAVPEDFRRTPQITDHRRWKCPVWACHFAIDLDNLDDAALNVLSAAEYLSLQTSRSGTSPNGARIVRRVVQDHYLKHVPGLRRLLEK